MDYSIARRNMVESQIRPNKVIDRALIETLSVMPREKFVPPAQRGLAYIGEDLPVGDGRFLTEPMILARLIQSAALDGTEQVLVVGSLSGYSTAILSSLARAVSGLDSDPRLVQIARQNANDLGLTNVSFVAGPMATGIPDLAPFDVILIDGAVASVPEKLRGQLRPGGRLITVIKRSFGLGQAILTERIGASFSSRVLFDAATPILTGFEVETSFVF